MASPLRVLLATTHVHFPQGGGGLERNTHELCLALKRRGIQPGVLCSLRPDGSWLSTANRARRLLLRQQYPRDMGCGYPVYRGWLDDGAAETAARFRPDLAIVQVPHPGPMLATFARCGIPGAAYVHEVEEIDDIREVGEAGIPVLSNSRFTAQRLRERCGVESEIIRPLIHPEEYRTATRPERVLFINTIPRKGVTVAMALAEARPDIPFDFVLNAHLKPGPLQAFHEWAAQRRNVTLHGPRRDMRPLYATARILLAPSQWEEAWGRVATEAHVNGIPVLGSNRGGLPESVGPGGILLPADAPHEAWLAALGRLWDDPAAHAEYARAAKIHSARPEIQPEAIADHLCSLLPGMAARQPSVFGKVSA
ncbi:MAG TPA: glycosyltransferase [Roseomonas sp.]|jgi:glycosyltransferase involved in cell wall biosynthesis